jgi:hypothetical protein
MTLLLSTVTQSIAIWQAPLHSNEYLPIAGASVTLSPPLEGSPMFGDIASGTITGLSIPVQAGTKLIFVYSVAVTGGLDIATAVLADVSAAVAIQ